MEELEARLEKALKLNKVNLDDSIIEFGELYYLFTKYYLKVLKSINKVEISLQEKFSERYSYYKVDYDIQLSTQEIKMFIENDKETIELRQKLKDLKSVAEIVEKHLKNIESTRWDARNLIEYMKIKGGIY